MTGCTEQLMDDRMTANLIGPLLSQSSDGIYIIDPESGRILDANQAGCDALRMTLVELLGESVLSLNKDVKSVGQWSDISRVIREHRNFTFVGRHRRKDGTDFPVEVITDLVCHDGRDYFVSVARDLSGHQRHNEHLLDNELIQTLLLNESSDGLWDWSLGDNSLFLSPQWFRMLGYGPHEIESPTLATWQNAVHPEDIESVLDALGNHLDGKTSRYSAKYRLKTRDGEYIWVRDRGMIAARNTQGEPVRVIGLVLDISEAEAHAAQLMEQARRDPMTQLYNRRAGYEQFEAQLSLCQSNQRPMSVVMLDIDHFKQVNDHNGHLAGDQVICQIATLIEQSLRDDEQLFRWGGEEFLLLLPGLTPAQAGERIEAMRTCLKQQGCAISDDVRLDVTFSAGISAFPQDGDSIRELVHIADAALYGAKNAGRDRIMLGVSHRCEAC